VVLSFLSADHHFTGFYGLGLVATEWRRQGFNLALLPSKNKSLFLEEGK
jgi:hypothetical protein